MRKSRSVDSPAGSDLHSKISGGKRQCILIHLAFDVPRSFTTLSNKKD